MNDTNPPADPSDREFQEFLRAHKGAPAPRELGEEILAGAPSGGGARWTWVLAAAACALVVAGFWFFQDDDARRASGPAIAAPELPAGVAPVRLMNFVNEGPNARVVLLDMRTLETRAAAVGSSVGPWSVTAISADSIQLRNEAGETVELRQDTQAREWDAYVSSLSRHCREQVASGSIDFDGLERLRRLVLLGDKETLAWLRESVERGGLLHPELQRILGGGQSLSQIERLLHTAARDADDKNRAYALRSMGKIPSPLVRDFLRERLDVEKGAMLALVCGQVAEQGDVAALDRLRDLSMDEEQPRIVVDAAREALNAIAGGKE